MSGRERIMKRCFDGGLGEVSPVRVDGLVSMGFFTGGEEKGKYKSHRLCHSSLFLF